MRSTMSVCACAIAMLLSGCAGTKLPASVSGGIDRIFPEPPHEIRGLTKADQDWIDETIATGTTCCQWMVKPRPAGLDKKAVVPSVSKPAQKRGLWKRLTS